MRIRSKDEIQILSPLESVVYYLSIPPMKESYVENAVRYKLKSMYPGDPQRTSIDIRSATSSARERSNITSKEMRVVVHAKQRSDNHTHAKELPYTIPGYALLSKGEETYSKKNKNKFTTVIGILIAPEWTQCTRFDSGIAIAGTAFRNESGKSIRQALDSILSAAEQEKPTGYFYTPTQDRDTAPERIGLSVDSLRLITLDEIVSQLRFPDDSVFIPKKPKKKYAKASIIIGLILLDTGALTIRLQLYAAMLEKKAIAAKELYEKRKTETFEVMELINKRDSLIKTAGQLGDAEGINTYEVFDHLSRQMQDSRLTSFNLQDSTIKITAITGDALESVDNLRSDPFFSDIALNQAVPADANKETAIITGRIQR